MLDAAVLAPHPDRLVALDRAWRQLIGPGPELSSVQRRAVIADARAAWAGAPAPNAERGVAGEAAHWSTVGQTSAPHVLDGHPEEGEALRDLHQPMYVHFSRIGDGDYVPFGAELAALADAMGAGRPVDPAAEREALRAVAGDAVSERAISVAATFQMMNRLLDGVGAPVHERFHPLAVELGFELAQIPR